MSAFILFLIFCVLTDFKTALVFLRSSSSFILGTLEYDLLPNTAAYAWRVAGVQPVSTSNKYLKK
jgi:hypothetical protein